jgi:RHS repeat-associated protein
VVSGSGGVDAYSGLVVISAIGMSSNGFNLPFGTDLTYLSNGGGSSLGFGSNWRCVSLAGLSFVGGNVRYQTGPEDTRVFLNQGGGAYAATYFIRDVLFQSGGNYRLLAPEGGQRTFDSTGRLTSIKSAGGAEATVTYDSGAIDKVGGAVGAESWEYDFAVDGDGNVTSIVYKVDGRPVLRADYDYASGKLNWIKIFQNAVPGSGTPDWGTSPVRAQRFTYHASGLLRHVVPPAEYRQMANNGLSPDTSTDMAVFNDYAETEYEYHPDGRVSKMYTHGRLYEYGFTYSAQAQSGTSFNVWRQKTEVSRPGQVVDTFYFNAVGEVILKKIEQKSGPVVTNTWYPVYQKFEEGSARILLSSGASAIDTVSESLPGLVTLKVGTVGQNARIEEYSYNADGLPAVTTLRNGTGGPAVKIRELAYTVKTETGIGTVRPLASSTIYRDDGGTDPITTTYSYLWHSASLQPSKVTITLPVVSTSENGLGATVTRVSNYDILGYLTSSQDERETTSTYEYDKLRGGLIQKIEDQGTGKLNLQTNYTLDDEGRTILTLGPAHDVDIGGTATNLRSALWTYYLDREGKTVSFRGYQTTAGTPVDQIVGPVTVSEPNLAPPSGYSGYRQSTTYDAVYGSSGIPSPTTTYAQSTWVRWKVGLYDKSSKKKEEWTYFQIPSSGYGAQSTNYGKKLFAYDSAGRLNQTTCAGGTIDKTTFNAMGWAMTEELGTSAGLVVTRANQYDDNGNLTKMTLPVNATTSSDQVTDYRYDWRNRRTETETNDGTYFLIAKVSYDNRDLLLDETRYHTSISTANRTAYQTFSYDVLGRQYRSQVYGVSTTTGATSNPQISNVYYEPGNRIARNAPSGSALFTATIFDAMGRPLKTFRAYEPSGFTPGSDPSSVENAVVMEQQEFSWDQGSNLRGTITRLRFDTATGNGELEKPGTAPEARASYVASYPDALGRVIATADYGAAASATWTRPATVPDRSDTVLVNSTVFDGAGNATEFFNPDAVKTTRTYDDSDRLITLVENATGSVPAKRTTHYEYTDDGWLRKLKCDNATTGQQVTEWVYGVVNQQGSELNSNRLVLYKIYADSAGGNDREYFGYNRQQQVHSRGDQNGTLRILQYDKVGRLVYDVATIVGSGVDNAVVGRASGYNQRGLKYRATSYSPAPATAVNDVYRVFNDFDQLVTEYQEHSGLVNVSTSPKVQYSYANGSANTIRLTGITYPDGTVITNAYASAQAGFLSRPDQVTEGSTVVASMRYLGLGTQIGLNYDAAGGTELTYEDGGTSPAPASDKYTGLDQFGRLVETIWKNSSGNVVQSSYGRNRTGGVVWRRDDKAHSLSVISQDDYYWYDGLQQVTRHDRGNLTPSGGPPFTDIDPTTRQQQEDFTYDETGNWPGYQSSSPSLAQTRTHNKGNEITSITNPSGVVQPVYDANGNMTTMPKPGDWTVGYTCKWDVWNRLVEVKQGNTVVASYAYDAETRRIKTTIGGTTRNFHYNSQWRTVEERVSNSVKAQYVWSPLDRRTLIRRKRSISGTLDETRFCLRDYLDPVAIIDSSGAVEERYGYDAFGKLRIMEPDFDPRTTSVCEWNWLFHGELIDGETSLYNYGYRFYNVVLGRWLTRDPVGEAEDTNLYMFVANDAPNARDHVGLKQCCCCAEDAKFEKIGGGAFTYPLGSGHAAADQIKLVLDMSFGDSGDSECPCGLEWWEWSNNLDDRQKKRGVRESDWNQFYPPEHNLPELESNFDKWKNRNKCSNLKNAVDDEVAFGGGGAKGESRLILIVAALISNSSCGCAKPYAMATFWQYVVIGADGSVVTHDSPLTGSGSGPLLEGLNAILTFPGLSHFG